MASRKPPSASEWLAILERIEWQGRAARVDALSRLAARVAALEKRTA